MNTTAVFFLVATGIGTAVLVYVLAPLLRAGGRGETRAAFDMQVYRDQLREIEADVARGVLTEAEAEAVRVEISRRLLAASEAESREAATAAAPRRMTLGVAAGLAIAFGVGTTVVYVSVGAPGLPDQPLAQRLALLAEARANRPGQAEAEARVAAESPAVQPPAPSDLELIGRLRAVLEQRPDDIEGYRLLARSEASLGRWPEARAAQERLVALLGGTATSMEHADLAEFMIIAAQGYVSPEAEAALTRALDLDPNNPVARYYSGLSLMQGGRPDLTLQLWSRLLAEGPPNAPWIAPIASQIDEVAARAGQPAPPVPSREEIEGAAAAASEETEMILGMVRQLSDRLATEGGPPADWARLIRSLGVLGRQADAQAIWAEARTVFAADPAALAEIAATAEAIGLTQ